MCGGGLSPINQARRSKLSGVPTESFFSRMARRERAANRNPGPVTAGEKGERIVTPRLSPHDTSSALFVSAQTARCFVGAVPALKDFRELDGGPGRTADPTRFERATSAFGDAGPRSEISRRPALRWAILASAPEHALAPPPGARRRQQAARGAAIKRAGLAGRHWALPRRCADICAADGAETAQDSALAGCGKCPVLRD
jgi:hypothetical protein